MATLKKHLLRAQQMASEMGGASKTSALSEELIEVEKNTQKIRQVYTQALKRVEELLVAAPAVTDVEKRLRKQATYVLGTTLQDNLDSNDDHNETLYNLLQSCGECQVLIAKQSVRFELQLQETVMKPMTQILQDIKELELLKRKLNHARLDMDMARKRSTQSSKTDPQLIADAENAQNQFNMSQDTYITALLSFTSKESEHIQPLHNLLTCQQQMYSDVSKLLSTRLPSIQISMEKTAMFPVFGTDLEKHLEHTGKPIAIVLQKCCHSLLRCGIESAGLFRLAGSLCQLRKLKAMFDSNRMDEDAWEQDVFTLAQAIKLYLRELPDPLLTFPMFQKWCDCINLKDMAKRIKKCRDLIELLPTANQTNLQYLMWFLKKVADKESVNKMGASNLGLVLGPNILRSEEEQDGENLTALNSASALTRLMIIEYDTLFPTPLHSDLTSMSLPRTATMSIAASSIRPDRPSVKAHKKGKAPTPKKPGVPVPPPRVDLPTPPPRVDLPESSPNMNKTTPPKPNAKPVTTPAKAEPVDVNPLNPFDFSDDEGDDEPVPPKRSDPPSSVNIAESTSQIEDTEPIKKQLSTPSPKLPPKPKHDFNPFGSDDQLSPTTESNFNPFAESDDDVDGKGPPLPNPKPTDDVIPIDKPNRKAVRPAPISQQLSESVSFDRPESPSFTRSATTPTLTSSPSHSRTPSQTPSLEHRRTPSGDSVSSVGNISQNSVKQHSRNLSSSSADKPVPPPRPSFDK